MLNRANTKVLLIKSLKIASFDNMEHAPINGLVGNSSVVAAKLVRECLMAFGKKL